MLRICRKVAVSGFARDPQHSTMWQLDFATVHDNTRRITSGYSSILASSFLPRGGARNKKNKAAHPTRKGVEDSCFSPLSLAPVYWRCLVQKSCRKPIVDAPGLGLLLDRLLFGAGFVSDLAKRSNDKRASGTAITHPMSLVLLGVTCTSLPCCYKSVVRCNVCASMFISIGHN